ncbi:MAG: hypothetical protein EOO68_24255, partial [Moraxellaceae bacterium]
DMVARIILIGTVAICIAFSQFVVPFIFKHVMKSYQIDRIYSMLGQEVPEDYIAVNEDEEAPVKKENVSDYNVMQSKIAIGSGGLFGKGFLNGTSTKNDFVPEQNTDFIFCAIGEQFGFVGSGVLIVVYLSLMMRILFVAERQRSHFSRIVSGLAESEVFILHKNSKSNSTKITGEIILHTFLLWLKNTVICVEIEAISSYS